MHRFGSERVLQEEHLAPQLLGAMVRGRRGDRGGELVARPDHHEDRDLEPLLEHLLERVLELWVGRGIRREEDVAALEVGSHVLISGIAEACAEVRHADQVLATHVDPAQQTRETTASVRHTHHTGHRNPDLESARAETASRTILGRSSADTC